MAKHIDNVPSLKDFKAPWESETGETEIDKAVLKKYIHNLITDKAKAQDGRDEAVAKVSTLEAERDEYKEQVESKDPDSGKKISRLEADLEKAKAALAKAEARADRAEVAHEKNLTPAQAKRLQGETKDELAADADEIIELFGGAGKNDDDDEGDEDDEDQNGLRSTPTRKNLTNPVDRKGGADQEPDYEAIAAEIGPSRIL